MKNKNAKPGKQAIPEKDETDKPQLPSIEDQEQKREKTFPGYPTYPADEDIMNKGEKEDLDVENITRSIQLNKELREEQAIPGDEEDLDLDVPGAELDDKEEALGEEDEENNYYSLGGERHEDLEEDPS